jgi:hypothetical protein
VDIVWPTRFYGVKTLNSDKIALEFKNVADEVLAHLRSGENTSVTVRIEIEATDAEGFNENRVPHGLGERPDPQVRPVRIRGKLIWNRKLSQTLA